MSPGNMFSQVEGMQEENKNDFTIKKFYCLMTLFPAKVF